MLTIVVPGREYYDEANEKFIRTKDQTLDLEHSLVSISKWESKWHKPFLSSIKKTDTESLDYFRFMTVTRNVDPIIYDSFTDEIISTINKYIENPMSATIFTGGPKKKHKQEVTTSETIYYWLIALQIPFDCEKWHLNRLLALVDMCNIKNSPQKKMSRSEVFAQNKSINDARRLALKSKG